MTAQVCTFIGRVTTVHAHSGSSARTPSDSRAGTQICMPTRLTARPILEIQADVPVKSLLEGVFSDLKAVRLELQERYS